MVSYVMATPTLNHKSSASGQRHAFAAAAKTSKISTESSALRRETLREDGGRVRLDAGELAEARPGDAHCLIVGWCPRQCGRCRSTEMASARCNGRRWYFLCTDAAASDRMRSARLSR